MLFFNPFRRARWGLYSRLFASAFHDVGGAIPVAAARPLAHPRLQGPVFFFRRIEQAFRSSKSAER
jgi:hypothetical protein